MPKLCPLSRIRTLAACSAAGLVLLFAAACQENSRGQSPTAPMTAMATIQGTVVSGADHPSLAPGTPIAGARITTDSGRSAVTDGSGAFQIERVPAGTSRLTVESQGLRSEIVVATPGRGVVNVRVGVSRHGATVSHDDNGEAQGSIQSVNPADKSFVLMTRSGNVTVKTDAFTVIRGHGLALTFADLKVGQNVEVSGALQADKSILARMVQIEDDANNEAEAQGSIQSVNPADKSLVLMTRSGNVTIKTDVTTNFRLSHDTAGTFADLKTGQMVEVEGTLQTDSSILAKQVSTED